MSPPEPRPLSAPAAAAPLQSHPPVFRTAPGIARLAVRKPTGVHDAAAQPPPHERPRPRRVHRVPRRPLPGQRGERHGSGERARASFAGIASPAGPTGTLTSRPAVPHISPRICTFPPLNPKEPGAGGAGGVGGAVLGADCPKLGALPVPWHGRSSQLRAPDSQPRRAPQGRAARSGLHGSSRTCARPSRRSRRTRPVMTASGAHTGHGSSAASRCAAYQDWHATSSMSTDGFPREW
jgi:hypothetical protein